MPPSHDRTADGPIRFEIAVAKLPRDGLRLRFEPAAGERETLARFLGILSVEALTADLVAAPWKRDGISVRGRLQGEVVQACVLTLEPVPQRIDEAVDLFFVPQTSKLARVLSPEGGELLLDPTADEIPDTFAGDRIDLGAALSELTALTLDPYPTAPESRFEEFATDGERSGAKVSPFAALRQLKPGNPPDEG